MYYALGMFQEALTSFDFSVISDDTFIGAYFEKGKVLEKLGRYNEAIENYEATISMEDPTSHAFLRLGKCHEKLGNSELAKYYYYHTVHEDPLLDKGWLAITNFHYRQKDFKKALYHINKAINIDGENPLYWKKAATIYLALDNLDDADFAFKQAVYPGHYELETWKQWAEVLRRMGDLDSTIQILIQAIEFYPESALLHYRLAGAFALKDNGAEGMKYLGKALGLDPDKLSLFEKEFPGSAQLEWVRSAVSKIKGPSTRS